MTKKRFKTNYVGCIVDYEDNLKNYDGQEIVVLLNQLDKENKQLLRKIKTYHNSNQLLKKTIDRLRTENSKNKNISEYNCFWIKKIKKANEDKII